MPPTSLLRRLLALVLILGCAVAPASSRAAGEDPTADTRRLLSLLAGVRGEYHEAFDAQGNVSRSIEIEEAKLLLAEARDLNARLALVDPATLDAVARDLDQHMPPSALVPRVEAIAGDISARTGVRDEPLPPEPPSAARGQAVFTENCAGCHGATGDGGGSEARRLGITPANFSNPAFMRGETPRDHFNVVSLGRRRSGMPEWADALSVQQRWDAVSYLWSLAHPQSALLEGKQLYLANCAGCHDADAAGRGPQAVALPGGVPSFRQPGSMIDQTDTQLMHIVSDGVPGTTMAAFGGTLSEDQRWKTVAWVRALSLGEAEPPAAASGHAEGVAEAAQLAARASAAVGEAHRLLDEAIAARRRGEATAGAIATDAYMRFEPFEKRLGAVDPGAVTRVEEGFVRVRGALREPGTDVTPALEAEVAQLHRHLEAAVTILGTSGGDWARFVQSAGIILREGFEIVLIVGALLTYVRRSGQASLVRPIHVGVALGVLASVGTAVLLSTVLRLYPGASDVLEGAAMLLAAGVLFWVSYWLVAKAGADRWQRFIQGRVKEAMAAGSSTALAVAAFLAVYREGFETVLFYRALLGGAPAGDVMVGAGFLCGLVLLAGVWMGLSRLGLRVPLGPFFLVTGGFLYAMAIVFAGRGVFELQDAGVIGVTPVPFVPRVPVLGIFPTLESLAAQGVLVAALVVAGVVTWRRRLHPPEGLEAQLVSGGGRA
ncbi:MAG TPA: c-type cytochrome [Candidatus Binatia bacterium]|nr:c-type cytochrome [Candidatus Binatia bacterium]